jgi:hypothetical protein
MAFYQNAPLPDTNARQVAQTIRMPSTALLTIDSEDRYADYNIAREQAVSPYNFTISKTESLMPGFMTRIGISEVVFPWVIPNINPRTNEIIFSVSNGEGAHLNSTTISLVQGFYTPDALATALENAINAYLLTLGYGDTISILYGILGIPNFEITAVNGGTLDYMGLSALAENTAGYPYPATSKQLYDLLGLGTIQQFLIEPTIPIYGSATLCQAIRYIDIVCNQLTNSQAQKDQTSQTVARDMLCRLYLGDAGGSASSTTGAVSNQFCPPGCAPFIIYRNFATPKQIQWIPNQNIPGFLQFQVYDDTGALLNQSVAVDEGDFQAGYTSTDWSMTMLVSEN